MTPRLVLEVLDGRAGVKTRALVEALPATIGRSYTSDIVLDDPYACPTHVRIAETEAGELVAEDAGSVNGLYLAPGRERVARVALRHGTELRVGRTTIRVRDPAIPLPPTRVEEHRRATPAAWLTSPLARAGVIVGALAIMTGFEYAGTAARTGFATAIGETTGMLLVLAMWAGVWALATRVVSHRFAFTRHLAFAAVVLVAMMAYGSITEWINFFAPSGTPGAIFSFPVGAALLVLLVHGHLGIASSMTRAQRLRAALGVTGGIAALTILFAVVSQDMFTSGMSYEGQLKPVPASWVPTISVERFAADAQSLRENVDEMASDSTDGSRG